MTKRIAQQGDKTIKGVIKVGTSKIINEGKPLILSGDKAWCNKCKGYYPILGTGQAFMSNEIHVIDGDKVQCRCNNNIVIASSSYIVE